MVAGSASGVHWKQFIAECGIEYGLQIVTSFFLNSPDCLYIKKSCKFLQSYRKTVVLSPRLNEVRSARCRQFPRPLPILAAAAADYFPVRCENEKVGLSPATIRFSPATIRLSPVNSLLVLHRQVVHITILIKIIGKSTEKWQDFTKFALTIDKCWL